MSWTSVLRALRQLPVARGDSRFSGCRSTFPHVLKQLSRRSMERRTPEMLYPGMCRGYYFSASYDTAWDYTGKDVLEYNKLIENLNSQKRSYLARDVYEDMLLDGVQPVRDTFYLFITGCTMSNRLQDVIFFFEEMKAMGLTPDVPVYNSVIAACGRSLQIDRAFQVAEEMESFAIRPKNRTFLALLKSCAVCGRVDEAYGVLRRMAAYGLTLNPDCYCALIMAHKNKKPFTASSLEKIFEVLNQSKVRTAGDHFAIAITGEDETGDEVEEDLLNFINDDTQGRRGLKNRRLMVYHTAISALTEVENYSAMKEVVMMVERDGMQLDSFCVVHLIRAYLHEGNTEQALSLLESHAEAAKHSLLDFYLTLLESIIGKLTPPNVAAAEHILGKMKEKGFFLNGRNGSNLLIQASHESAGNITVANLIWDVMVKREIKIAYKVLLDYRRALERHNVQPDDPRLLQVKAMIEDSRNNVVKVAEMSGKPTPDQNAQSPV